MPIIYILIGFICGGVLTYLRLSPQLKNIKEHNRKIDCENEQLEKENLAITNLINNKQQEYSIITAQITELNKNLEQLEETQTKAAQSVYNQALQAAELNFDKQIDLISQDFQNEKEKLNQLYLDLMNTAVQDYEKTIILEQRKLNLIKNQFEEEQNKVNLAVESAKRKIEIENNLNFYKLNLSADDIEEIKKLRAVLPFFRDKTPLNKVIYKVYYEKPLTDMIGRVVGTGIHTGIYKITNIENQMCYVGQSTDIANRFKQHIKRGVGAEDWTSNKLYPVMYAVGPENFTFEIIEECDKDKLNERESFWQEYFHAKDFGYSIK